MNRKQNLSVNSYRQSLKNELATLRRDQQRIPYRTSIPADPPTRVLNPVVERVVRLGPTLAGPLHITAAAVTTQDALNYGATGKRYLSVTIVGVKAWGSDTGVLSLSHAPSGFILNDEGTAGQQRARAALRIPPSEQLLTSSIDTADIFLVSTTAAGEVTADVVCRFV